MISALKKTYGAQVVFIIADVDSREGGLLAAEYKVSSIPALLYFAKDGSLQGRHDGWPGREAAEARIRSII